MSRFSQITFNNIKTEIETFLKKTYSRADVTYSPASPFGHILTILEELFQLSFLYKKRSIDNWNLSREDSNNRKIIRTNAIIAGHNPSRAISATGTLRLRVKGGVFVEDDIPGGQITISNRTLIKNNTNGLDYIIDLGGADRITYKVTSGFQFFVNIKQGIPVFDEFTGSGELNQTISLQVNGSRDIENFSPSVSVNGESWEVKKHLFDLLPSEKACVIRTGIEGGIDVVFGNNSFGAIPPIGSIIRIDYIRTDGSRGNIFRRTVNDWTFIDDVVDGFGSTIDLATVFDVFIANDINFGADAETVEFTKSLLPMSSNNYVLALPEQYAFQIKKLGVFSHVNAYEQNGIIYIVATPNIKLFKNRNADYFTIDLGAFILDDYEKSKIDKYLRIGGNIQLTRKYKITSPELSFYILNIFIITYDDAIDDNVNAQIQQVVSDYFIDLTPMTRIPKIEIERRIVEIYEVVSVDIRFISKSNEDYHREYIKQDDNRRVAADRRDSLSNIEDINLNKPIASYNPNEVRGLDPVLGDIIFEANEIPVIRGGWEDRYGTFYSDTPDASIQFSSINIIKKGTMKR